jgi:hypothetical protein
MFDDLPGMIAELDAPARSSAHDRDHSEHVLYSRLATVFGEFRNGLATRAAGVNAAMSPLGHKWSLIALCDDVYHEASAAHTSTLAEIRPLEKTNPRQRGLGLRLSSAGPRPNSCSQE